MLDTSLKTNLKYFRRFEAQYTLDIAVAPQHESRQELTEMLADVANIQIKYLAGLKREKNWNSLY